MEGFIFIRPTLSSMLSVIQHLGEIVFSFLLGGMKLNNPS